MELVVDKPDITVKNSGLSTCPRYHPAILVRIEAEANRESRVAYILCCLQCQSVYVKPEGDMNADKQATV